MGRDCTGWRDCVGRVGRGGSSGWVGVEIPIPKAPEFPPQCHGALPLLAYLTLSQEMRRLPLRTL